MSKILGQKEQSTKAVEDQLTGVPGSEPGARLDAWWWLVLSVIVITVALAVLQPDPFLRILRYVRDGVWVTIFVTVTSFFLTLVLGLFGGLGRISKNRFVYGLTTLYVEIIRGIPLLVQLIWWYFAFPAVIRSLGIAWNIEPLRRYEADPILFSVIGLTICYGAYMSEIFRAGIQSIPPGQMEAARSLGMNYLQAMRYVILPQAFRIILPPVGNEFTALLKDSSLVSVVSVPELTRRGREFMATNFNPIEVWSMIALVYLIMTLFSARVAARIERNAKLAER